MAGIAKPSASNDALEVLNEVLFATYGHMLSANKFLMQSLTARNAGKKSQFFEFALAEIRSCMSLFGRLHNRCTDFARYTNEFDKIGEWQIFIEKIHAGTNEYLDAALAGNWCWHAVIEQVAKSGLSAEVYYMRDELETIEEMTSRFHDKLLAIHRSTVRDRVGDIVRDNLPGNVAKLQLQLTQAWNMFAIRHQARSLLFLELRYMIIGANSVLDAE